MDSYLMMLYVTLDQESALKSFFIDQGWNFLKPDLTVITDKIGPVNSLSTQCRTPAQATFPVETDKVSPVPENTIHVEISGKHNPKPSNSRKRQANSKQTKHPVAKVPKLTLNLSTRIRSANSSEKSQPEFLVQIQDDNIEPDFANIVHEVTVKEEPVDTDSDIGPECDDVDDNESTDEAEESHEVSAGNGVNNASDRKNVTEGNGEQDKEETNKDLAKPKDERSDILNFESDTSDNKFTVEQSIQELPSLQDSNSRVKNQKLLRRCKLCQYSTTSRGNLCRHIKTIHEKRTMSCDTCSKIFKDAYNLEQHRRSVHLNIKMMCEFCSEMFDGRHSLRRHRLINHLKVPKYVCEICGQNFYEKASYDGHLNKHVNARPYNCQFCNKSFGYKYCLQRHLVTCSKEKMDQKLDQFKCTMCDKQLKSQASLAEHTKGAHGPKNKQCPCGKAFSWQHSLFRHQKTCHVVQLN